jgi:hypothetical protein
MPIHLLRDKATPEQVRGMLAEHVVMIKIAVDIRRRVLAGGGKMHADCEAVLLADGSAQDDIWGANWYPTDQSIEFESLINIRPRLGNRSIVLQGEARRDPLEAVTRALLGGVE